MVRCKVLLRRNCSQRDSSDVHLSTTSRCNRGWSALCTCDSGSSRRKSTGFEIQVTTKRSAMKLSLKQVSMGTLLLLLTLIPLTVTSAVAQQPQQQQPNILFIMGDDIGWMQPRIYHRGLM